MVQINALESLLRRFITETRVSSVSEDQDCGGRARAPEMRVCVHSVCKCDNLRTTEDLKQRLVEIVNQRSNIQHLT